MCHKVQNLKKQIQTTDYQKFKQIQEKTTCQWNSTISLTIAASCIYYKHNQQQ